MSASAFIMKQSRSTAVDYLPTLMVAYQQLFIKNPAESYDLLAYTKPLTWESWLTVLIFCAVVPFIMLPTMMDCTRMFTLKQLNLLPNNYVVNFCFDINSNINLYF